MSSRDRAGSSYNAIDEEAPSSATYLTYLAPATPQSISTTFFDNFISSPPLPVTAITELPPRPLLRFASSSTPVSNPTEALSRLAAFLSQISSITGARSGTITVTAAAGRVPFPPSSTAFPFSTLL
ncbi:hypothetical protein LY76DRAFT_151820 [Colletotrichum caudatum]|nr:hypothetical protein LY76DRAFT_151820 [Colletotrichum caudatum]